MFIYSEKATKFCEIFPLLWTVCTAVQSKGKISQNFVGFSEYMNFNKLGLCAARKSLARLIVNHKLPCQKKENKAYLFEKSDKKSLGVLRMSRLQNQESRNE